MIPLLRQLLRNQMTMMGALDQALYQLSSVQSCAGSPMKYRLRDRILQTERLLEERDGSS